MCIRIVQIVILTRPVLIFILDCAYHLNKLGGITQNFFFVNIPELLNLSSWEKL